MTRVSSRLIAHTGTRQLDLLDRADAASDAVDAAIVRQWDQLARALTQPLPYAQRRRQAWTLLHGLWLAARDELQGHLTGLARQGYHTAAGALAKALPAAALNHVARRRGINESRYPARLSGSGVGQSGGRAANAGTLPANDSRRLVEDAARDRQPGLVRLGINQRGQFAAAGRARQLREPAFKQLTPEQQREQFQQLLFPAPSEQQVQQILRQPIAGRSWVQDLTRASTLAGFDPDRMAALIATGFALGKPPREIAQTLLPVVNGVKSSARRIARTYGMQVAHHASMTAYDQAGDLIAGYQIHAQLDQHTRPKHRARNGTIYYKRPEPGQAGLDEMPNPPLEADGSTAWNCRCWLAPVLSPVPEIETSPVFTTNREQLIPDPAVYSDWFGAAPLSARKLAVGARRYSAAVDLLGHHPAWETFVEPETGDLLSTTALQAESPVARAERVAKVRAQIGQRRRDIGDVATFGFVPGQAPPSQAASASPFKPSAPVMPLPVGVQVGKVNATNQQRAEKLVGRPLESGHFAALVGAQPGAKVTVEFHSAVQMTVRVQHPDYKARRKVWRDRDNRLVIENEFIEVSEEKQGSGIGAKAFTEQVAHLSQLGFDRVETLAAGPGGGLAGYHVWPKVGYDGPIPDGIRDDLPAQYQSAKTLLDLYSLPGGADWWKAKGYTVHLEFDLKPGSRSRKVLAAYLRERGKPLPAVLEEAKRRGEQPEFSPADLAALDRVWQKVVSGGLHLR